MPYFRATSQQTVEPMTEDTDLDTEYLEEGVQEYEGPGIADKSALIESIMVDEVSKMNDEERKAYLESEEFALMQEAGGAGKRSIVRMNKMDDFTRRKNLASLQKAKEMGDSDWEALRKNRIKERQLLQRIYRKYGNKVQRDVMMAQRQMQKINPQIFNTMRAIR